jgi:alkyldihydroxyacetonephosphate synthase
MEVAAPWSKLGDLYAAVREAMRPHVFVMAHLSHAYPDGCSIYFTFAGSADDDTGALAKYDAVWREAPLAAARAGGTISHHHGVGRSKAPRLAAELGFGTEVVRALARRFDPAGIFNPGNLLPPADARRGGAPVAPTDSLRIDDHSLLVTVAGDRKLGDVEAEAETRGMSLRIAELPRGDTVRAFIARGCPGVPDPFEDPADHFVAGFSATLREGAFLHVPAGPRKAVGPDLLALFWGTEERAGVVERAVLRLHRKGLSPRALPVELDRSPAITPAEARWVDELTHAAGRA